MGYEAGTTKLSPKDMLLLQLRPGPFSEPRASPITYSSDTFPSSFSFSILTDLTPMASIIVSNPVKRIIMNFLTCFLGQWFYIVSPIDNTFLCCQNHWDSGQHYTSKSKPCHFVVTSDIKNPTSVCRADNSPNSHYCG